MRSAISRLRKFLDCAEHIYANTRDVQLVCFQHSQYRLRGTCIEPVCKTCLNKKLTSPSLQEAIMGVEEKGGAKEKVEAMQKKFDVRVWSMMCT